MDQEKKGRKTTDAVPSGESLIRLPQIELSRLAMDSCGMSLKFKKFQSTEPQSENSSASPSGPLRHAKVYQLIIS